MGSTAVVLSAAGTGQGAAGGAAGAGATRARPEIRQCTLEPPKPKLEMATVPPRQGVASATTCTKARKDLSDPKDRLTPSQASHRVGELPGRTALAALHFAKVSAWCEPTGQHLQDAGVQAGAVGVGLRVVQVRRQHAVLVRQADLDQRCTSADKG